MVKSSWSMNGNTSPPNATSKPPSGITPLTVKLTVSTVPSSSFRVVVFTVKLTSGMKETAASTRASPISAPAKSGCPKAPANSGASNRSASLISKSSPATETTPGALISNNTSKPSASSRVSATKKPLAVSETLLGSKPMENSPSVT